MDSPVVQAFDAKVALEKSDPLRAFALYAEAICDRRAECDVDAYSLLTLLRDEARRALRGGAMCDGYQTEDIERGRKWYLAHKIYVDCLIANEKREFPMSGSDIRHPELWKPAAWKWFLKHWGQP